MLDARGGHEYDYTAALLDAARAVGLACTLYTAPAGRKIGFETEPIGHDWPLAAAATDGSMAASAIGRIRALWRRTRLRQAYAALFAGSQQDDLWFLHTAPLPLMVEALKGWQRARAPGRLVMKLRRVNFDRLVERIYLRQCLRLAAAANVTLVTDSHCLARQIGQACGNSPAVLPIPLLPIPRKPTQSDAPVFAFLGARRRQKGFHLLPDAIGAIQQAAPRARFAVQCYFRPPDPIDAEVEDALARLRGRKEILLIDRPLPAAEFCDTLAGADVVLLPYLASVYGDGSSGVFAAAVANGKAAMYSPLPWIDDEIARFGLERAVPTDFADGANVAAAAGAALAAARSPRSTAEDNYAAWHSGASIIQRLCAL
jgi:hypothetical protein